MIEPFDMTGITRGADQIKRYDDRPASLLDMLRATVDRRPANEAIVEIGGPRLNYRELWDRAAKISGGLRDLGIERGDRVAIRLGNGVDWCLAFWGGLMAGAIVVPVNTRFSEPEVEYVVTDSGSKFVFLPGNGLPEGRPYVVDGLAQPDVAAIFYTSGTTGFPKGAMTTHVGFLSNIENCHRVMQLPRDGSVRSLVSVPLFHVTGCNSQLLPSCETGSATVIMPQFDIQAFLRAIVEERIDAMTTVPAIYWYAMNQPNFKNVDTSGVRWLAYGGAPIAPDLVARILEAFPNARVGNGFGLTETSSVATFLPHEYARTRPETVGFAAPVCDVALFETDRDGVGELLVRGPNIVKGYWNKLEATAATFVDGWLHTGDLARLDSDGFVQIVDRKKDMVNRGGENVYCVEVENALAAHPCVLEAAVMGVPDAMMGEKVGAIVVLKPGAKAEAQDLCSFLGDRLADFKVPQYVMLRSDPLPRNAGGKILKGRLRKEAEWGKPIGRPAQCVESVPDGRLNIGAIVFPGMDQMDFTGPFAVLSRLPNSEFHVLWKEKMPVRDSSGLILTPEKTFAEAPPLDVLIVPGGPGQQALMEDEIVLSFIRTQARQAEYVLSVCTGALICGAAGLLQGRQATTHWASFHLLEFFGAIPIDERVVVDGFLVSTAGVSAGIDGALRVAALVRGDRVAQSIQLGIEYAPEPPFNTGTPKTAPLDMVASARKAVEKLTEARLATAQRIRERLRVQSSPPQSLPHPSMQDGAMRAGETH